MAIAVLRPYSHMSKEQFGRFDPKQRIMSHANTLMSVIWTFRAFSYIYFEYWLVHALGTVAYVALGEAEETPTQMDILIRACQCLHEMRATLPLATDVLSGIQAAFRRYNLAVPRYMTRYFATVKSRKDGLMHHAMTALLPSATEAGYDTDVQLQQLLDAFDDIDVD